MPAPSGFLATWLARLRTSVDAIIAKWTARRRRLRAGARLLGSEIRQLGARFWDRIDSLHVETESFRLTPIRTQFYGHGAFMGAAPALLADARWRRILGFLMPDVFEQVRTAIEDGAHASHLMGMFENNPILAAFGVSRTASASADSAADITNPNHLVGIEWDLFVDSELLERWESATTPAERAACAVTALDTSLIAHASPTDTVQEALGMSQYADVRSTPKSELGGVELDAWLDLFGRALFLSMAESLDAAVASMSDDPRSTSMEECMRHTFVRPWEISRVVGVHAEATGKKHISVIVEIKSLRSTPEFLADVVGALNERGVHVAAVASFLRDEVRGVSAHNQILPDATLPGPRELQFFHFAGDVQSACDCGDIERGQSVLFNGASLLDAESKSGARPTYSLKTTVIDQLDTYRTRHDLHVGLYVQEGDCDHTAAALLADLVATRADTFELGFAWGGLRDEAHLPMSDEIRLGYGSQRMLEYVGRARQWELGDD